MRLLSTIAATFLFVASMAAGDEASDAEELELLNRIVGGTEVTPQFKYPWMVTLFAQGNFFCGGSFIAPDYVLTAAHCSVVVPPSQLNVAVHRHDLRKTNTEEVGITRAISKVIIHPNYNPDTTLNDYALWKLSAPITGVEVVPLDTTGTVSPADTETLIMGWGTTAFRGRGSPVLLETNVLISNFATCNQRYGGQLNANVQICAGIAAGGKDTCQGDSGGPLLVQNGAGFVQVGVVSFGDNCALPNTPGVYARVAGATAFIAAGQDDTRTNSCETNPCPAGQACISSIDRRFCLVSGNGGTPNPTVIGSEDQDSSHALLPSLFVALLALALSFLRF